METLIPECTLKSCAIFFVPDLRVEWFWMIYIVLRRFELKYNTHNKYVVASVV